jgi:hypothetical protein
MNSRLLVITGVPDAYSVNADKPEVRMVGIPNMLLPELMVQKRRSRKLARGSDYFPQRDF